MNFIKNLFSGLSYNARILMVTEPSWTMPMAWIGIYLPIYQRSLGLTETQIGWMNFYVILGQIPGVLVGGYLADHWGRKKTLMIFDTICWGIPLGLWVLAGFLHYPVLLFTIAAIIWGMGMIVLPAWLCLFTEDSTRDQTQNAFAILWIFISSNGIFAPFGGFLVKQFGLIPAFQYMMIISTCTVTFGIAYRWVHIKETLIKTGTKQIQSTLFSEQVRLHLESWKWIWHQPLSRILLTIGFIAGFYALLWNGFSSLYWTDKKGLQLSDAMVSIIPAIGAITTIIVILFVLPRLRNKPGFSVLFSGSILVVLGMIFYLMNIPGTMYYLVLYAILFATGSGIMNPIRDSLWFISLTKLEYRAKIISIVNFMTILVNLPVGPLGGYLYKINPKFPFLFCLGLGLSNVLILLLFVSRRKTIPLPGNHPEIKE